MRKCAQQIPHLCPIPRTRDVVSHSGVCHMRAQRLKRQCMTEGAGEEVVGVATQNEFPLCPFNTHILGVL